MLAMAVQRGSVALYTTCIALAGLAFGGVPVLRFSMLADVADLMQLQTQGKRDEGRSKSHEIERDQGRLAF